ncbi:hypothetical protein POM88_052235 [Heracleum sosnowskyi]|uniref:CASP-like protein n=1 Tax=Heracleum sosnowskyi TaxID=360622 RepID=A0AAD8GRJ8_9APIA|nr:hypothetical protein POM88_052235 [Heracleum sosnowskyi]
MESSPSVAAAIGDKNGEEENGSNSMRTAESMLRLLPMSLCIVSLVLVLTNSQSSDDFGLLSYSDLGAFRYLVQASGVCAGYSLLSALVSALPRPSTMPRAWTFFLLDQVFVYVLLVAGAVSTEFVYLAYKGDAAITWSGACGSLGKFCHKATASLAITFAVVICYAVLSLVSSYRLFSRYDAPIGYTNKGIDMSAVFRT